MRPWPPALHSRGHCNRCRLVNQEVTVILYHFLLEPSAKEADFHAQEKRRVL
nr:MAG TPA: hypothetical protein [Caudoviricetes sp.]DAW25909.1 MAG TPA: hypothetical protein [Caudoviricetes sp.]